MGKKLLCFFLALILFSGQVFASGSVVPMVKAGDRGLWGVVSTPSGKELFYKGEISAVDLESFVLGSRYDSAKFWVNLHPFLSPDQCLSAILQGSDVGWVFMEADLWLKRDLKRAVEVFEVLFNNGLLRRGVLLRAWIEPAKVVIVKGKEGFFIKRADLRVKIQTAGDSAIRSWQIDRLESWLTELVNYSRQYALLRRVFRAHLLGRLVKEGLPAEKGLSVFLWDSRLYQKSYIALFSQKVFKDGLSWVVGGVTFKGRSAPEIVRVPTTNFYQLGLNSELIDRLLKDYFPNLFAQGGIDEAGLKKQALELLKNPPMNGFSEEERLKLVYSLPKFGKEEIAELVKEWKTQEIGMEKETRFLYILQLLAKEGLRLDYQLLTKISKYADDPTLRLAAGIILLSQYPWEVFDVRYDFELKDSRGNPIPFEEFLQVQEGIFITGARYPLMSSYVLGIIASKEKGESLSRMMERVDSELRKRHNLRVRSGMACMLLGYLADRTMSGWLEISAKLRSIPREEKEKIISEQIQENFKLMLLNLSGSEREQLINLIFQEVLRWNREILSSHMFVYVEDVAKVVVNLLNSGFVDADRAGEFLNNLAETNPEFLYVLASQQGFGLTISRIISAEKDKNREILKPETVLKIFGVKPILSEELKLGDWIWYVIRKNKHFANLNRLLNRGIDTYPTVDQIVSEIKEIRDDELEIYLRLLFYLGKGVSPAGSLLRDIFERGRRAVDVMDKLMKDKTISPVTRIKAGIYLGELEAVVYPYKIAIGKRENSAILKKKYELAKQIFAIAEKNRDRLIEEAKGKYFDRLKDGIAVKFALENEFLIASLLLGQKFLYPNFKDISFENAGEGSDLLFKFLTDPLRANFMFDARAVATANYEVNRLDLLSLLKLQDPQQQFLITISHEVGHVMLRTLMRSKFKREELGVWIMATIEDRYIRTIDEFLANYIGLYFFQTLFGVDALDKLLSEISDKQERFLIRALSEGEVFLYSLTEYMLAANREIFSILPSEFFLKAVKEFYTLTINTEKANYVEVLRSFYNFLREQVERRRFSKERFSYLDSNGTVVESLLTLLAGAAEEKSVEEALTVKKESEGGFYGVEDVEMALDRILEQGILISGEKDTQKIISLVKRLFEIDPLKGQLWGYILAESNRELGLALLSGLIDVYNIAPLSVLPAGVSKKEFLEKVGQITGAYNGNPFLIAMVLLAQEFLRDQGVVVSFDQLWNYLQKTEISLWLKNLKQSKSWVRVTNLFPFYNPDFAYPEVRLNCYEQAILPDVEDLLFPLSTQGTEIEMGFRSNDSVLGSLYPAYLAYVSTKVIRNQFLSKIDQIDPEDAGKQFLELLDSLKKEGEISSVSDLVEKLTNTDFYSVLVHFSTLLRVDKKKAKEFFDSKVFPMMKVFLADKKGLKEKIDNIVYIGNLPPPRNLPEWFLYWIGNKHGDVIDYLPIERSDKLYKSFLKVADNLFEVMVLSRFALKLFDIDKSWQSHIDEGVVKRLKFQKMSLNMIALQIPIDGGLKSRIDYDGELEGLNALVNGNFEGYLRQLSEAWQKVLQERYKGIKFIFKEGFLPVGLIKEKGEVFLFVYRPWGRDTQKVFEFAKKFFKLESKKIDNTISLLRKFDEAGFLLSESKGSLRSISKKQYRKIEALGGDLVVFNMGDGFTDIEDLLLKAYREFERSGFDLSEVVEFNGKLWGILGGVSGKLEVEQEEGVPIVSDDIVGDDRGMLFKMAVLAQLPYQGEDQAMAQWLLAKLKLIANTGNQDAIRILKEAKAEKDRLVEQAKERGGIEFGLKNSIMMLSQ